MLCWKNCIVYVCRIQFSTILNGYVNRNSDKFINSKKLYDELLLKINNVRLKFSEGGGERAIIKHVQQNKKTLVKNRLQLLFDRGKYLELCYLVGFGQTYGDISKGGSISAVGKINNRLCVVVASDATVKGGTVYPIQIRKQLRILQISLKLRIPLIFIIDSGGAFLPLQAEIFPDKHHGGRVFYSQAVIQSKGIPAISLVCGSCTAGAAYIPSMCSEMGMVNKTGHVFLGGPALVKAATGEIVEQEELGGALMHASVSGGSDHTFMTEKDGLLSIRDMVSTFPDNTILKTNVINPVDSLFSGDDLNGFLINEELDPSQRRIMMIQILARLLDESLFHEFKPEYGKGLITGFGRIFGCMVGILAGFDSLTEHDCFKGSHFVQICGHRSIPLISFVHTVDDSIVCDQNNESNGMLIKAKSTFMRSIATRNSKMITVVVGNAMGADYMCLGGEVMEPEFIFAWPNAQFLSTETEPEDSNNSSILHAAGNMLVDEIIEPEHTRQIIAYYLEILHTNTNLSIPKNPHPVYRF